MVNFEFDFSEEKNVFLKEARGIGFEEIIIEIEKGRLIDDVKHFNKEKYPKQRIYILSINNKIYAVPYVVDKERKVIFLKTIYPNRKLKKKYIK